MRMHDNGEWSARRSVTEAKTGHRFDALELDATDFLRLREMSDRQLKEWVNVWACGFPPIVVKPRF